MKGVKSSQSTHFTVQNIDERIAKPYALYCLNFGAKPENVKQLLDFVFSIYYAEGLFHLILAFNVRICKLHEYVKFLHA